MQILLLNAGSSSLKCTLVDETGAVIARRSESVTAGHLGDAVRRMVPALGGTDIGAVGHRIVHGGAFSEPVRITDAVRARIAELSELAPLHNPPGLETLAAAEQLLATVPHVAVFDTAFHRTLPAVAYTYPLPRTWLREWGIRKYGFHGLSHAYAAKRAAALVRRPVEQLRTIVCHLGHGCSATAVLGGRSIDTTMGFTPLDGLMMATRSGSIDPGIVTYVAERRGLEAHAIDHALNHEAGLAGVSELSDDMREVLAAATDRAALAVAIYAYRVRQAIGAFAVTLGGLDVLVFTGGVGEHAAEVRALTCQNLGLLGLELDVQVNSTAVPDADVATRGSRGRILVIEAREDIEMLAEVMQVLS